MSFDSDIAAFADRTGARLDQLVRKIVIDLTVDLVRKTPVDTGHARSNYFWGVTRVTAITETKNESANRAMAFAATIQAGGVFYITNNLPYIFPIMEFGHSKQAPTGMLTKACSDWQARVNRMAAAV